MSAADRTREWIEGFVLARDLCPFAHEPWAAGEVRVVTASASDAQRCLRAAIDEVARLAEDATVETTLVVFDGGAFESFEALLDAGATLEALLEESGLDADVQVVAFHPAFRFDGADPEDPANRVNRSPYPMLHLLRAASVERAVARYPDAASIADRNAAKLRGDEEV